MRITGELLIVTEKAFLVRLDETGEEKWLPQSVVEDPGSKTVGYAGEFEVKDWFAQKENLPESPANDD
jgi:hypothetical protein